MTNIPKGAWPVIEIIRRDVPRLKTLPTLTLTQNYLRWRKPVRKKWMRHISSLSTISYCPMGLHPKATTPLPIFKYEFPINNLTDEQVRSFAEWWDSQRDPKKAMKALYEDELI